MLTTHFLLQDSAIGAPADAIRSCCEHVRAVDSVFDCSFLLHVHCLLADVIVSALVLATATDAAPHVHVTSDVTPDVTILSGSIAGATASAAATGFFITACALVD